MEGVAGLTAGKIPPAELQELRRRAEATLPWINNNRFIDFDRYVESNNAFHDYWVSRAHSDALLVTYRRLGIGGLIAATRGPRRETSDEVTRGHARIVEALEAADVDEVKRLIIEHRELTKQLVLQGLAEIGGTY